MQVHELCDETLYWSLALPSLKQHTLVKIAGTLLLSRPHIAQELIQMMLQYHAVFAQGRTLVQWHQRWKDFRERISDDIDQLPNQNIFKNDYRDTTMHLLRNVLNFPNPRIFNPAITMKFTARGDLDLSWMFEDYTTRTLRVPLLPQKKKYELLTDACHLYQEQCVQSILCDLLDSERSVLVPSLSNAGRTLEIQKEESRWRWDMSFELEDVVSRGSWDRFVTMLNSKRLEDITFSFEHNVMKVTSLGRIDYYTDIMFLWPKLTTSGKYDQAHECILCALVNWDTPLFIRTISFLEPMAKLQLKDFYVLIVDSFLKHPHDRHFLPDFQLDSAADWIQHDETAAFDMFRLISFEIFLEGKFCSHRRDALIQLWRYTSSRNKRHGDRMLLSIKQSLDHFVKERLFRYDLRCDSYEAIRELYEQFDFATDLFAELQASEDNFVRIANGVTLFVLLICVMPIFLMLIIHAIKM